MDQDSMQAMAKEVLAAWTSQDVEAVLSRYTDDLVYVDPNTRGAVRGAAAMRRYLCKLFANWEMTWTLKEAHLFKDGNGCAAMWHATFQRPGGSQHVEADGMDLVLVDGDCVKRNEVYFDRSVLAPLL